MSWCSENLNFERMFLSLFLITVFIGLIKIFLRYRQNEFRSEPEQKIVAFFHPFCNAGGGGERVLWSALKTLHEKHPDHRYVIYSDNYKIPSDQIIAKAKNTFHLDLKVPIQFVNLNLCCLLSANNYPAFTLLGQSIGSMILGIEALLKCPPDVFVDTMGASFTYPIFRFVGFAKVSSYTHYPVISTDMLNVVAENRATFNNREFIARSPFLTKLKLFYYRTFALLYRFAGKSANVVMVNSSWTKNHIDQIWKCDTKIVYPPCNVDNLLKLKLDYKNRNTIISIGQFRPEKNHLLQLEALKKLVQILDDNGHITKRPLLVLIGSCRNEEDNERVKMLIQKCEDMKIPNYVEFKINLSYDEMVEFMEKSSIAIHTMTNEHFGISVVEFLAAGLLTVVHNSGGPKLDIITENETGFLGEDSNQFAQQLYKLMIMPENEARRIRIKARDSVKKFSQNVFEQSFYDAICSIL